MQVHWVTQMKCLSVHGLRILFVLYYLSSNTYFDQNGVYGMKLINEEIYAIIITRHAGMVGVIYILVMPL